MQHREKILNAIVTKLSHLSLGFLAERQNKAEKRRFLKSEGQVVVQLEFLSFREINR